MPSAPFTGSGTPDDPWILTTPPGTSAFAMHRDETADPPALVCQVGKTQLRIYSKMRNGMIFIDGSHIRYRFDYGDELEVVPQFVPLTIFGLLGKRRG